MVWIIGLLKCLSSLCRVLLMELCLDFFSRLLVISSVMVVVLINCEEVLFKWVFQVLEVILFLIRLLMVMLLGICRSVLVRYINVIFFLVVRLYLVRNFFMMVGLVFLCMLCIRLVVWVEMVLCLFGVNWVFVIILWMILCLFVR